MGSEGLDLENEVGWRIRVLPSDDRETLLRYMFTVMKDWTFKSASR